MKKILLILTSLLLIYCKSNTANQLDKKAEVLMKGNWIIQSVTSPEYFKVNSFEVADSKCLEKSEWKFVSNNNKGTMKLAKSDCPSYETNITWYVNREGNVVLKFLDDQKARKVTSGYVLKLANQTETSFDLIDNASVGSNKAEIIYKFTKI